MVHRVVVAVKRGKSRLTHLERGYVADFSTCSKGELKKILNGLGNPPEE